MPEFLESHLKAEYGDKSKIPYKIMNAKGYMRGSKETAKGAALQRKHDADTKQKRKGTVAAKIGDQMMHA